MRQRRQRDVAKENEFYMQLMQQALPAETSICQQQTTEPTTTAVVPSNAPSPPPVQTKIHPNRQSHEKNGQIPNGVIPNGVHKSHRKEHDHRHIQRVNHSHTNGAAVGSGTAAEESAATPAPAPSEAPETRPSRRKEKKEQDKEREANEYLQRLEMDTKRLRSDLQSSRASEQELRLQVSGNNGKTRSTTYQNNVKPSKFRVKVTMYLPKLSNFKVKQF